MIDVLSNYPTALRKTANYELTNGNRKKREEGDASKGNASVLSLI